MRSPFPGMDPYIEPIGRWADFHFDLIAEIKRGLEPQLPARYFVELGERSYIDLVEAEGKKTKPFAPDVRVTEPRGGSEGRQASSALAEPATAAAVMNMQAYSSDEFRETFVEIHDLEDEEALVTSIEVLSPSNKRRGTEGWRQFLRKRQALRLDKANVVEIDLLRAGTRMPMVEEWPETPYALLVCRGASAPLCRAYNATYRERTPTIPVPLRPFDTDLTLDLQPMIDAIYARSRYRNRIHYTRPLDPPLPEEDAVWLAKSLQARETQP